MKEIIERIKEKTKLYHAAGCSVEQIIAAERQLGLRFSDEYRNYVLQYGAISFGAHEFTGLNVDAYIDVIAVTKQEREARDRFPLDCIVVQQLGIEGLILVQDEDGVVYQLDETDQRKYVADSFAAYLTTLL